MNTYTSKSTVDRKEAEALKEMIFNRVRARAEAMNNEVQASYVDNVHNELMDSARVSFEATKNPFSLSAASPKVEQKVQEKNVEKADVVLNETEKEDYKKFQKRFPDYFNTRSAEQYSLTELYKMSGRCRLHYLLHP